MNDSVALESPIVPWLRRVLGAVWLGSAVFLAAVAAPAAFRGSPDPAVAASIVGAMLTRWHYMALGLPLILFVMELRRARALPMGILVAGIVLAAAQVAVDMRVRAIRGLAIAPIHQLPRHDPLRRQFGMLHGVSMMLLLGQTAAAAAHVGKE